MFLPFGKDIISEQNKKRVIDYFYKQWLSLSFFTNIMETKEVQYFKYGIN